MKELILQENINSSKVYAAFRACQNMWVRKLKELRGETKKSISIAGDFTTLFFLLLNFFSFFFHLFLLVGG